MQTQTMPLPVAADLLLLHRHAYEAHCGLSEAMEVAARLGAALPEKATPALRRRLSELANEVAGLLDGLGEELAAAARVVGDVNDAPW